jgi:hypothetical protein
MGSYTKHETSLDELTKMMAGGEELERLSKELEKMATDGQMKQVARELVGDTPRTAGEAR